MTARLPVTVSHLVGDDYSVRVGDHTEHTVRATPAMLTRVGRPGETVAETVERAFAFLLDREPPESILRRFALEDIARYFPEFWSEMSLRTTPPEGADPAGGVGTVASPRGPARASQRDDPTTG